MSIINLTPVQLRKAADLKEKIAELQTQLNGLLGGESKASATVAAKPAPVLVKKRTLSAAHKAKIKAAQKLRWAKYNAAKAKAAKPVAKATK